MVLWGLENENFINCKEKMITFAFRKITIEDHVHHLTSGYNNVVTIKKVSLGLR